MLDRIKTLLAAPVFPGDEEKTRTAALLHVALLTFIGAVVTVLTIMLIAYGLPDGFEDGFTFTSGLSLGGVAVWLIVLNHRGRIRIAGAILATMFWLIMSIFAMTGTSVLFTKPHIFDLLGVDPSVNTFLSIILYILIITPVYFTTLLLVGTLFGQYRFFSNFILKIFRRKT